MHIVARFWFKHVDGVFSFCNEIRNVLRVVGSVFVVNLELPFGGFGKSGYGREKGREAPYNYVQTKNIGIALG